MSTLRVPALVAVMSAGLMLSGCITLVEGSQQNFTGNNRGAAAASSVSHKDSHNRGKSCHATQAHKCGKSGGAHE